MTDFDIDVVPGVVWDDIQKFNTEFKEGKLQLEKQDYKYIKITEKASDEDNTDLVVKVKFFKMNGEEEEDGQQRLRVRFVKK